MESLRVRQGLAHQWHHDFIDEGAFPGAAHTRDRRQGMQRDLGIELLEVVFKSILNLDVIGTNFALHRQVNFAVSIEIGSRQGWMIREVWAIPNGFLKRPD